MRNESAVPSEGGRAPRGGRWPLPWEPGGGVQFVKQRLVGNSAWALSAPAAIVAHAAGSGPLLVEGEPGAGKQFVARLVHDSGRGHQLPFVAVPCEGLEGRSLEAALFSPSRSLPDAAAGLRREFFERARGGTLYVSDVSVLSEHIRTRVLDAVEQGGEGLEGVAAGTRVVFGSCAPLARGRRGGSGRLLDGLLRVPPLRERGDDLGPLAEHFVEASCRRTGRETRTISAEALSVLAAYRWPGNVGELKRVVETALQSSGPPVLDFDLLPVHILDGAVAAGSELPQAGIDLYEEMQRYEVGLISAALRRCGGVQTKAARLLGVKVSTLNSKISNLDIDVGAFKPERRLRGVR